MTNHEQNLENIKNYLTATTTAWHNTPIATYNKLILDQGKAFIEVVKSDSLPATRQWRKTRKPKAKQCFYNAQLFVMLGDVGEYYEGYCYDGLIPFHHAWNVIDGKVVDFTLEARDRLLKRQKIENNAEDAVYLGVLIPKEVLVKNILKTRITTPLAQKHEM